MAFSLEPMTSFFKSRVDGTASLETVFWTDMLLVGTLLNLAATGAALGLFAGDYPPVLALAVNFAPIPWNGFIVLANWRSAEREGGPPAVTARVVSVIWFFLMIAL